MEVTLTEQLEAEYQQFLQLPWEYQISNCNRTAECLAQLTAHNAGAMGTDAGFSASVEAIVRGQYLQRKYDRVYEYLLDLVMAAQEAQRGPH